MREMIHEQTIEQLGGLRNLKMMLGVKAYATTYNTLRFRFKGSRRFNICEIELTVLDLYTVRFYQNDTLKEEFDGVYCDQLQSVRRK